MSNICAVIGRGQMTVVDEHIAHHKKVQKMYEEMLAGVSGLTVHRQPEGGEYDSNYWLCTITLDESRLTVADPHMAADVVGTSPCVEALRQWLDERGIESRPLWKPMHMQPVYAGAPAYVNGVSERLFHTGLCLPAGPYVGEEEVKHIVGSIKQFIESCSN